jgi:uncharacterized phosphatase
MPQMSDLAVTRYLPTRQGTVLVLRHGATTWNAEDRKHGRIDVPLSARGRAQMRDLAADLADLAPTGIATSPLTRAVQSAAILAEALGIGSLTVVAALTERSFGVAEGWTETEIRSKYDTDERIPGREPNQAVAARALPALQALPTGVLVVTHHGVIRSLGIEGPIGNGTAHTIHLEAGA